MAKLCGPALVPPSLSRVPNVRVVQGVLDGRIQHSFPVGELGRHLVPEDRDLAVGHDIYTDIVLLLEHLVVGDDDHLATVVQIIVYVCP